MDMPQNCFSNNDINNISNNSGNSNQDSELATQFAILSDERMLPSEDNFFDTPNDTHSVDVTNASRASEQNTILDHFNAKNTNHGNAAYNPGNSAGSKNTNFGALNAGSKIPVESYRTDTNDLPLATIYPEASGPYFAGWSHEGGQGFATFHAKKISRQDHYSHDFPLFFPEMAGANAFPSREPDRLEALAEPASGVCRTRRRLAKTSTEGPSLGEARLSDTQSIIEAQQQQICELDLRVKKLECQSESFRKKAMTFRALYSQQQQVSEQLMASIVQLRDRRV
ncbi:hypothetical protein BKA70DRAFT_1242905 [Coprinopsis sp. MPI-PUGE-AT-0042]|nr:hypothetical protein BKA70DRAFT_1242905 [Coprinopsis sp. MPI-PUGE-AT-0042]